MPYTKQEKNEPFKELDKLYYKSIELGFDGNLTPMFYAKLKQVKRVRQKLKSDLFFFIVFMFTSIVWFIFIATELWQLLFSFFLSLIMFIAIIKNVRIWFEISRIKETRFKEYYEKINKPTQ